MNDDLPIPNFLRREVHQTSVRIKYRAKRIPYPKDGYKCKGMRQATRERHRQRLRRRAERMRVVR